MLILLLFICVLYLSARGDLLAFLLRLHGAVGAVEELPLEELHGDDGKDEHEELVDDEDVEDVL